MGSPMYFTINFADEEWENPESVIGVDPKLPGFISPDPSITTEFDEYPDISGITNAREAMKKLPEEDRAKIEQQVIEKLLFLFN
jgi:hypothetical protein